jgi:hypothetical protein
MVVLTSLSLADNCLTSFGKDMSGVIAIADALKSGTAVMTSRGILTSAPRAARPCALPGMGLLKEIGLRSNSLRNAAQLLRNAVDVGCGGLYLLL